MRTNSYRKFYTDAATDLIHLSLPNLENTLSRHIILVAFTFGRNIPDQSKTYPGIWVAFLPPIEAVTTLIHIHGVSRQNNRETTYKVLFPEIRGCNAHVPPTTRICFPSMKSAKYIQNQSLIIIQQPTRKHPPLYPGYISIGLKPG